MKTLNVSPHVLRPSADPGASQASPPEPPKSWFPPHTLETMNQSSMTTGQRELSPISHNNRTESLWKPCRLPNCDVSFYCIFYSGPILPLRLPPAGLCSLFPGHVITGAGVLQVGADDVWLVCPPHAGLELDLLCCAAYTQRHRPTHVCTDAVLMLQCDSAPIDADVSRNPTRRTSSV